MRRGLFTLALLTLMAPAVAVAAPEEGGTPPIVVVPVPEMTSTTVDDTAPEQARASPASPAAPTISIPIKQAAPPGPGPTSSMSTIVLVALMALALLMLVVPGLPVAERSARVPRAVKELPARRTYALWEPKLLLSRPAHWLRFYEMLALRLVGSQENPSGVVLIRSARYESMTEAIFEAHAGRESLIEASETSDIWWVVRAGGNGAIMMVLRPDGEIGLSGRSLRRINELLAKMQVDQGQ